MSDPPSGELPHWWPNVAKPVREHQRPGYPATVSHGVPTRFVPGPLNSGRLNQALDELQAQMSDLIVGDAPPGTDTWGRSNAAWVQVLARTGGFLTGPLELALDAVLPLEAVTLRQMQAMGAISDGPQDGRTYGRLNGLWNAVLPLTGGAVSGLTTFTGAGILLSNGPSGLNIPGGLPGQVLTAGTSVNQVVWGAPNVVISDRPPASPLPGALWWDSLGGSLYVYYDDGNSAQWVVAVNVPTGGGGGITDAPSDGTAYGRRNGVWAGVLPLTGGTVTGGVAFTTGILLDSPANLSLGGGLPGQVLTAGATNGLVAWAAAGGGGITDAPSDGSSYGRRNGAWAGVLPLTGGTLSGPLNLPAAPPTTNPQATNKLYVDTQDAALQGQIDALANNLVFIGQIDIPADDCDFTVASGVPDGVLPAPSAALLGRYVIVTQGGSPPAGNIPAGAYAQYDWLVCDATPAWVHLELGASTYVASDIAIAPAIGALGANVQTGLAWLEANTLHRSGGTMTGPIVLPGAPTLPLHAATQAYADLHLKLTGGTLTGALTLAGNAAAALQPVPLQQLTAQTGLYLPLLGGTLTGPLTLAADPATALGAATQQYVDAGDVAATNLANTKLPLAGGTMTGAITLAGNAAAALEPVSLQQMTAQTGLYLPLTGGTLTGPLIVNDSAVVRGLFGVGTSGNFGLYDVANVRAIRWNGVDINDHYDMATGIRYWSDTIGSLMSLSPAGNLGVRGAGDFAGPLTVAGDATAPLQVVPLRQLQTAVAPLANNVGRNLLHNGLFNIQQRGIGPFATSGYTLDRWRLDFASDLSSVQAVSIAGVNLGDEAAESGMQVNVTGNAAAGAFTVVSQYIESVRRLAGKTVTVSFYAYAVAGSPQIGVAATQVFGTGGAPSANVNINGTPVTLSTTPTRHSVTFAYPSVVGKTLGTNADSYSRLALFFSSGATNNAFAGGIGVQSGTFVLWGVQLEIGSVATPLEKPDALLQVTNCQRFYHFGNFELLTTAAAAGGYASGMLSFSTMMRARPTIVPNFGTQTNTTAPGASVLDSSSALFFAQAAAAGMVILDGSYTASADL